MNRNMIRRELKYAATNPGKVAKREWLGGLNIVS